MFNAIKVCIYVEDVQRSVDFYTQKLGFAVAVAHPMGPTVKWTEMALSNGQVRLIPYPKAMMPDWKERKPSIVFSCPDVQATYDELSKRGVTFKGQPQQLGWGKFVQFSDSDGNEFGLSDAPLTAK